MRGWRRINLCVCMCESEQSGRFGPKSTSEVSDAKNEKTNRKSFARVLFAHAKARNATRARRENGIPAKSC